MEGERGKRSSDQDDGYDDDASRSAPTTTVTLLSLVDTSFSLRYHIRPHEPRHLDEIGKAHRSACGHRALCEPGVCFLVVVTVAVVVVVVVDG